MQHLVVPGVRAICTTPVTASIANHSTITGPNQRPTTAVPNRCTRNSATSTTRAAGTTQGVSAGVITLRPSIAPSTEMAGVMMLSP